MYYTIHSDKLNCNVEFDLDEGGYLWVRIGNQPRRQACSFADPESISIYMSFSKYTTEAERERQFHSECDRWYRYFIKDHPGY